MSPARNALENNVRLYKVQDGERVQLATADVKVTSGEWHTLKLEAVGSQLMVYCDFSKVINTSDTTFSRAGLTGLWTKADSITFFDAVTIGLQSRYMRGSNEFQEEKLHIRQSRSPRRGGRAAGARATRTAGATGGGPIAHALRRISKDLETGSTVGEGMRKWPRIFPPLDTMVVEVSDHSGNLPEGLRMLSKWYDLITKIRNTLILGLIWPVFCLHIAAFVFPVPHLAQSNWDFGEYGRSVIGILMAFYIPVIIIIVLMKLPGHHGPLRRALDEVILVIPVLGGAVRDMAISRYCLAFSMMARAGVSASLPRSVQPNSAAMPRWRHRLAGGAEAVKLGNQVVEGFGRGLPLEFVEMWRVGEETGDLATAAARLAKSYEERMVFKFMLVAQMAAVHSLRCGLPDDSLHDVHPARADRRILQGPLRLVTGAPRL